MADRGDDAPSVMSRQWLGQSTVGGGYNVQIGAHAGELPLVLHRPRYRLELRIPAPVPIPHVPAAQQGPSCLLRPQRQVVPFHPRPTDQRQLLAWRDTSVNSVSILWLHGATGHGKTRMASRLASLSYRDGWAVAQAVESIPQPNAFPMETEELAEQQPLLIIVEYAERWLTTSLAEMLNSLPRDFPNRRVRVLLLSRSREAWQRLGEELNRDELQLQERQLADFARGYAERLAAFKEACQAFADHLRVSRSSLGPPVELDGPSFASPLALHMAALAAVYANRDHELVPRRYEGLLGFLLEHERHYWRAAARTDAALSIGQMERLVVLATLFVPMRDPAARRALLLRTFLANSDEEADRVLAVHSQLYPPSLSRFLGENDHDLDYYRGILMPLQPDGFAEELIGQRLTNHVDTVDLLSAAVSDRPADLDGIAARRSLIILAATAERHAGCRTALLALLERRPHLLALAPEAVLRLVVEHAPAGLVDTALAKADTEQLRQSVSLVKRRLESLQPRLSLADRAQRLALMAARLAEGGRHGEALVAIREAVDIYRRLAQEDSVQFSPLLAATLQHQGAWYAQAEQHEEARIALREAVEIYRELARANAPAYEPALAAALDSMEAGLSKIGRHDEALEAARDAVEVHRRLAAREPERFEAGFAAALEVLDRKSVV
jgi:tetratricopeptide (TPR) repeat protein